MVLLPPKDIRRLALQDVVTLIHNVRVGATDPGVGFEDPVQNLDSLCKHLDARILIPTPILESALWSCNLLNEAGTFWDLKGRSFDEFLKQSLPSDKFDKRYNFLKGD